jgi:hypothetical protein
VIPKDRDAVASRLLRVRTPKGPGPEGPILRVMATRLLACFCCVRVRTAASVLLSPEARAYPPLAPSSAPDAMSRTKRCRLMLSVLGASLSTCCSRFGARRAYSTPRHLSRVTGARRFCSTSAAPSSLPGCQGRFDRVDPSLKEPRKVTFESLLCQVDGCRTEAQFAYPYLSGRHLPDSK